MLVLKVNDLKIPNLITTWLKGYKEQLEIEIKPNVDKSEETTFVKGHQLYYNFIRPHEGLNGYTPAHFANIYLNLGNKKWESLLQKSIKN